MTSSVLEKNIQVRFSDTDFDKSIKPFAILNYFQEMAIESADELGFGYSFVTSQNLMWVLLKYRIEFEEYPVDLKNITLTTQPRGYNKIFAHRNFSLSSNGKMYVKASSIWSIIDLTSKNTVNIENVIDSPFMPKFNKAEDDLSFYKVPPLNKCDYEKEFEVRYNDIDSNKHANNGAYIIWALEPLPFDFRVSHKLKSIDIVFKKDIKFGEKLISQVELTDDNTTLHYLKNKETSEDLCILKCSYFC